MAASKCPFCGQIKGYHSSGYSSEPEYRVGKKCALLGLPKKVNPYIPATTQRKAWAAGWAAGRILLVRAQKLKLAA